MVPPMRMREGFIRLTQVVRTSPRSRPAWRTAWIAWTSPDLTSSTTSDGVAAGTPAALRLRAIARPEATASRHPRLPQAQGTSAARGSATWPISPAAPCEPRRSEPPEMIPAPMPVATLTKMRSVVSGQAVVRSPRAMMLTSLSTKTGESKDSLRAPGTSNRSQPGMIGGLIGRPVENSTGPGRPMPMPTTSSTPRPARSSSSRAVELSQSIAERGPSAISRVDEASASSSPARFVTAMRECEAPKSAAMTTRARGLKANRELGRPPVDAAPSTSAMRPRPSS